MSVDGERLSDRFPEGGAAGGVHLCHVYNDDRERAQTTARIVGRWLAEGARVLCLEDAADPGLMNRSLGELGVDVAGYERAFLADDAERTYCPTGSLVPDVLLESLAAFCRQALSDGFCGARITGDMSWAARRRLDETTLIDYEIKATDYARANRVVAVCEYDARKFSGATIMDILSLHPAMIVRGQLVNNPLYLEPEEFLARRRGGAGGSRRA